MLTVIHIIKTVLTSTLRGPEYHDHTAKIYPLYRSLRFYHSGQLRDNLHKMQKPFFSVKSFFKMSSADFFLPSLQSVLPIEDYYSFLQTGQSYLPLIFGHLNLLPEDLLRSIW